MIKNGLLILLFGVQISLVRATVWQVGPTRTYKTPSAVATLVANGDTVEIDAGLYLGDVAKWFANDLVLKGVGTGRAHLEANGNNAEGKAIWVIKGKNCRVENIEFSGCKVPDQNGAGIRQEGQNLTLVNCFFHHNEDGILTVNDGVSDYVFEACEFAENGFGDGYTHNIYVGHVHSLTMRFCYSHDAKVGHLVKSRAERNLLIFNRLTGENGDGSYEVDLPNGGLAVLVGNQIEQSAASQNGGIVSFGLEGATNPEQKLALAHNTIVNDRFDGKFVQFSAGTTLVKLTGNLLLGPGNLLAGSGATIDTSFNLRLTNVAAAMLADPSNFDYRPLANSPCMDAATANFGEFSGIPLAPEFEYLHPLSHQNRLFSGAKPDIGAFEFAQPSATDDWFSQKKDAFSAFPNPFFDHILVKNTAQNAVFELTNSFGQLVFLGKNLEERDFSNLPVGIYFLNIVGTTKTPFKLFKN